MQLTESKLQEIIKSAILDLNGFETELKDAERVAKTAKVGEEAQYHTGSECDGYFAIEDSMLSSCYYDFPSIYHQFLENMDQGLRKINSNFFCEPINTVEIAIYQ